MKNIYIQTLKLGFENPEGISFNDVVEKLNIDLSNQDFKISYTLWFYENFYNKNVNQFLISISNRHGSIGNVLLSDPEEIWQRNPIKSHIKGDAVNKYIDYLELERTRKTSKRASIYSTVSIVLAALAIIISIALNPKQPFEVKIIDDKEKVVLPVLEQAEQIIISNIDSIPTKQDNEQTIK